MPSLLLLGAAIVAAGRGSEPVHGRHAPDPDTSEARRVTAFTAAPTPPPAQNLNVNVTNAQDR